MTSAAASLKEYLKRYESAGGGRKDEKRKKKKKKGTQAKVLTLGGVLIVEDDPTWQKPLNLEEQDGNDTDPAGEDNPVVDEDIEVKRLRRLEEIRARKPYLSVSEDGSGWVPVSDLKGGDLLDSRQRRGQNNMPSPERERGPQDLSPPRQRSRRRFHTPSPERVAGPSVVVCGESPICERPRGVRRNSFEVEFSPPRRGRRSSAEVDPFPGRISRERSSGADFSRPRRCRRDSLESDHSPPRHAGRSSAGIELSPGRQGAMGSPKEDLSPPRRGGRGSTVLDLSPPRRSRRNSPGSEPSPLRRARNNSSEAELSPPRRSRRSSPRPDLSPLRRARRSSPGSDHSPVRHARMRSPRADLSLPRRSGRSSQELIRSPSRRTRRSSADPDLSPRRGQVNSSDVNLSPSQHRKGNSSKEDLSPPRKIRRMSADDRHRNAKSGFRSQDHAVTDLSPHRRREKNYEHLMEPANLQRVEHSLPRGSGSKPSLDDGERKGGLYTGTQIREEINRKRAENLSRFESLDPAKSGKGAEPVYRNQGKRISKEEKLKLEKGEEKPKEKKLEWGKGLAQKREAEARALEIELEKETPFARTRDDPELDKMLKDRVRWGDPMAHLVKKKDSDFHLKDFGDDERMKESGFIVPQTIPGHSWIKRVLEPPPNRYGIKPGRHWDGVDRSTGYEKELFKRQNEKRATQSEAYLWSVAEM